MKNPATNSNQSNTSGRPEGDDFFISTPGFLKLGDDTIYEGMVSADHRAALAGEVVFNTGMTGYVETLTDPSYAGQILVFTFPLLGNYGVPTEETWESDKIHVRGVVVSEIAETWSHTGSYQSMTAWLQSQNIPLVTGIDTRALTKYLRTRGTMPGIITTDSQAPATLPIADSKTNTGPGNILKISMPEPQIINAGQTKTVIAVDCGMKQNIIRSLTARGLTVKRVPHDYDYTSEKYDGIFISNGPGDPTDYPETIAILGRAMQTDKPIFGICLGTQLLGLAAGGTTYKLRFGHRGHNQPVFEERKPEVDAVQRSGEDRILPRRGYITSQNHGYALAAESLPAGWNITFRNLNDDSVEGIAHTSKPFFAVQFHPEAAPGPTDTNWLFDTFAEML